jgi:hypothetical protein
MPGWKYRQSRCAVCGAPAFFNGPTGERLCSTHSEDAWRQPAPSARPAPERGVFDQPRIVTWADLERSVLPHVQGYDWAVRALDDLWRMSTPTPESVQAVIAGMPCVEKRILLPSVFEQWWKDVQQRRGIAMPLDSIIPVR